VKIAIWHMVGVVWSRARWPFAIKCPSELPNLGQRMGRVGSTGWGPKPGIINCSD